MPHDQGTQLSSLKVWRSCFFRFRVRLPLGPLQPIPANFPTQDPNGAYPIPLDESAPPEGVQDRGTQRGGQHANRPDRLIRAERRLDGEPQHVLLDPHAPVRLLGEKVPDDGDARRAVLPEALPQSLLGLLRHRLVVRRVARRVDGDEPDDLVRELEDPEPRGGRARVVLLDVQEVHAAEDFLGRVFHVRSIYPVNSPSG